MLPENRDRQPGGGRQDITETDATVENDLLGLGEDSSQGDRESLLKWTNKSLRTWEKEVKKQDPVISHTKILHLLQAHDYRLQSNKKTKEGTEHPDREAQFQHISERAAEFLEAGDPVISVDTKKNELVGNYKNIEPCTDNQTWQ
jgi:Rhodopirellula transposase DDE domain